MSPSSPVTAALDVLRTASEAEAHWVLGSKYRFLVTGKESGQQFALIETEIPPGPGPPPHVHSREDETFHVVEGAITVLCNGTEHVLETGGTVVLPRGGKHTLWNHTNKPAKFLAIVTPAGIENFFAQIGDPAPPGSSPPEVTEELVKRVYEIAPRFGIALDPPPSNG